MITPEIVEEFKNRMHLDDGEDGNLQLILETSNKALTRICGAYDISTHEEFKELVFERSRYVYNDALEYFSTNFAKEINSLSIDKALEGIEVVEGDLDASI
ncbi:TPA: phage gp6-like head-tail connector protein [Salmonella enterica subsp. enterica serovar Typhi str. AG3]|nr:phage gp6-like head-tail connector protein [Salmonella enterica subsp. enterica serovar Typhi str. AG3]